MPKGIRGTGPFSKTAKGVEYKGLGVRIHKNDAESFIAKLKVAGLNMAIFFTSLVEAYLDNDQRVIDVVDEWKKKNRTKIPNEKRFSFSKRERAKLLTQIMPPGEIIK